jgi:hypothetical protein
VETEQYRKPVAALDRPPVMKVCQGCRRAVVEPNSTRCLVCGCEIPGDLQADKFSVDEYALGLIAVISFVIVVLTGD